MLCCSLFYMLRITGLHSIRPRPARVQTRMHIPPALAADSSLAVPPPFLSFLKMASPAPPAKHLG